MAEDRDEHWWSLRKGTTILYVEWGPAHGKLFATDIKMRKGPPVMIALSLEKNLRTRSTGVGTYVDAQALVRGGLRELRLVQISDRHTLFWLGRLLQDEARTTPWRLLVSLHGEHAFDVEPEYRTIGASADLLLRVVRADA